MLPSDDKFEHLRFDPADGEIVRTPHGSGYGYWVGGHKVWFDQVTNEYVLFYRYRSPLEHGRGGLCEIATSKDGVSFEPVWQASKDAFAASSIEVGHCVRGPDGGWKLFISYEVESAGYWRIDLLEAAKLEELNAQFRRTIFQPQSFGQRSLKDPVVYVRNDEYWVYVIGGSGNVPHQEGDMVYVGGGDATFLARSNDCRYFTSLQRVFQPPNSDDWHGRRARINSVIPVDDGWLALYDGGRSSFDTYEEWCGLAWSEDGIHFERLQQAAPWIKSAYGSVRYVYAMRVGSDVLFYYEYTRPDLSHDLRVKRVQLG